LGVNEGRAAGLKFGFGVAGFEGQAFAFVFVVGEVVLDGDNDGRTRRQHVAEVQREFASGGFPGDGQAVDAGGEGFEGLRARCVQDDARDGKASDVAAEGGEAGEDGDGDIGDVDLDGGVGVVDGHGLAPDLGGLARGGVKSWVGAWVGGRLREGGGAGEEGGE
jgi:hypothetical protein